MYRIRFHGRGGQGMKTASRILGKAFFLEGYEVQDAPRYGAERRGAPIFAYVRAARQSINERGIITKPDLVIAADDTLLAMPTAGILTGYGARTILLIRTDVDSATWQERLNIAGTVVTLPGIPNEKKSHLGAACAGAAARLIGVISLENLAEAVRQEIGHLGKDELKENLQVVRQAFDAVSDYGGTVQEGKAVSASSYQAPAWIDLPFEEARLASPAIHAASTSEVLQTGLWRTNCPVIDEKRCNRCWWICSTFCPEGAILVDDQRRPQIDYQHCKGCLICLAQCPTHAIEARPEKYEDALGGEK